MMNALAVGLVLSSLAAASVWSPQPDKHASMPKDQRVQNPSPDPAVYREGHRVILVEYEREAPQQPPSVPTPSQLPHQPPLEPSEHRRPSGVVEEAKEKFREAASVLPNHGQGISKPGRWEEGEEERKEEREEMKGLTHGAKEKICDAHGVCKEKISGLFGKSMEKAAQVEEAAKEAVTGAVEKAKEVKEEVAGNVSEVTEHALDKARSAAEKSRDTERGAVEKAKEIERSAVEKAKEEERSAVQKAKEAERKVAEKAREVKKNATEKATEVRKNLTDILQRAREVARDAAAYLRLKDAADALAAVLHLLGFVTAYGACLWVTFVSSHILARVLPRQQFGILQSKLYPVYFRAMAYATGVALISHAFGQAGRRRSTPERFQGYVLLSSLVLILATMLFLEPKATKVMFERMKMEKEEGRGRDMADLGVQSTTRATGTAAGLARTADDAAHDVSSAEEAAANSKMAMLNRRLKRLNNYSSLLNVMTLMGLTWHLVHLSRVLQEACS